MNTLYFINLQYCSKFNINALKNQQKNLLISNENSDETINCVTLRFVLYIMPKNASEILSLLFFKSYLCLVNNMI